MRVATGAFAFLLLVSQTGTALADLQICNRSQEEISIAVGYNDPAYGWTSEGWWRVPVDGCATVIAGDLRARSSRIYYVFANGKNGGIWQATPSQEGGAFCTSNLKYTAHNRDYRTGPNTINCQAAGLEARRFAAFEANSANHRVNLGASGAAPSQPAPVPGVQPAPVPVVQSAPGGSACQRFPNLC